jgi:ABC-2 type transport system ATP-binding protein
MIEVEHLTKFYGEVRGIDDISFSIGKGEIVGFLGPNGSGKTTTMRILTCYMPQSSGTAKVAGFDVETQAMEAKRRIGYLPEHPPLYMEMTVRSYLGFAGRLRGMERGKVRQRTEEVVSTCGLENVADRIIGQLSKGYKQRVGLAQALIHKPELLILDEPTIGLDPKQNADIRSLIKGLAGDQTIILSTHILPEVSLTCQRVIIIHQGKIVADSKLAELTKDQDLEHAFLKLVGFEQEDKAL